MRFIKFAQNASMDLTANAIIITLIVIALAIVDLDIATRKKFMKPYQLKCVMYDENILGFNNALNSEMVKMRACEMLEKLKESIKQGVVNL